MTATYTPPATRTEAVDEILRSGFTIGAMLAVTLAFPLEGELADTTSHAIGRIMLEDYGESACFYLQAWGKASCPVEVVTRE